LGRTSADGADVVDHLAEIPLPGRIAAAASTIPNAQANIGALPAFVAGPENRLVAATVNRMLGGHKATPVAPHVLALFGPSGVGKTHLARGLVHHWQKQFGDDAAHYTTAADLRRALTAAIDINTVEEFRKRVREYRLLAIDDVHRLPSHAYLSHELRNMLDAYEESGGMLIVTSNRPAESLSNFTGDVRSRLASGLQLQLAAAGKAARVRIVRYASAALGRAMSDDAAHRLADGVHGTAPEMFGALFELWETPAANGSNGAVATDQLLAARAARRPTLPHIIAVVAKYTKVPQKLLKSASRKQSIVFARAIAVYLARELTGQSYNQIGHALGGRDHTTIMHNYQKIDRERLQIPSTQQTLDELRRIIISR
jgi:chromosomal replication initiator protein